MESKDGLSTEPDGMVRCWWHGGHPDYITYHDDEWGMPVDDEFRLFEKICLEGFQAGLSWLTILRKRENFREAFDGFDFEMVAKFNARRVEKLLKNDGIIRHRGKIEATVNNAQRALALIEEFDSLGAYFWAHEPKREERPDVCDYETLRHLSKTPASEALSKDLRKRGWKFVGPTTVYAFMQAMGIVNDHLDGCMSRLGVDRARKRFRQPK